MKYKLIVFDYDGVVIPINAHSVSDEFFEIWVNEFSKLFNKCKEHGCLFGFITAGNHRDREIPSHFYPTGFVESIDKKCWFSKNELCKLSGYSDISYQDYEILVPYLKKRALMEIHKFFLDIRDDEILFVDDNLANILSANTFFSTFHFIGFESFEKLEKEIFEL